MEALPLILCILLIAALIGVIVYLASQAREAPSDRGPSNPPPTRPPNEYETIEVSVRLGQNGKWQVGGSKPGVPLRVHRGDLIVWRIASDADGTIDAYFQFPSGELFNQLPGCDPWTTQIGAGQPLEVQVSENAMPGIYTYAVFVLPDGDEPVLGYAEGGSPPRMIIKHE